MEVPSGPINTLEEVFRDPQILARNIRLDLASEGVAGGRVAGLRNCGPNSELADALTLVTPRVAGSRMPWR